MNRFKPCFCAIIGESDTVIVFIFSVSILLRPPTAGFAGIKWLLYYYSNMACGYVYDFRNDYWYVPPVNRNQTKAGIYYGLTKTPVSRLSGTFLGGGRDGYEYLIHLDSRALEPQIFHIQWNDYTNQRLMAQLNAGEPLDLKVDPSTGDLIFSINGYVLSPTQVKGSDNYLLPLLKYRMNTEFRQHDFKPINVKNNSKTPSRNYYGMTYPTSSPPEISEPLFHFAANPPL